MKQFFKKFSWASFAKGPLSIVGGILVGLLLLAIVATLFDSGSRSYDSFEVSESFGAPTSPRAVSQKTGIDFDGLLDSFIDEGAVLGGVDTGAPDAIDFSRDAEAFETTEYNVVVAVSEVEPVCAEIKDLKADTAIIFESANESKRDCSYTFKATNETAATVVAVLQSFDPERMDEYTHTVKQVLEDVVNEVEILEEKLIVVEETLAEAVASYEDITVVARNSGDAESLAKIIESKLRIVERLTNERVAIANRLGYMHQEQARQLDRLDHTFFSVYVYEDTLIDGERIRDSWRSELRSFMSNVTSALQQLSLGFATFLLWLLPVALYGFAGLLIVKYIWRLVRAVWKW